MRNITENPVILLFEDRPKQRMIFQLNLNIYLDARVDLAGSVDDLGDRLRAGDELHLVVVRANMRLAQVQKVIEELGVAGSSVPVICVGEEVERRGLTIVEDGVKPLLQAAAKLLGVTARGMVSKNRPETYEISPEFLRLLFTFPCDVYDRREGVLAKIFAEGAAVPRQRIEELARAKRTLEIDSLRRLKLANAVAEQSVRASEDLDDADVPEAEKLGILNASFEIVAAQFQSAGMDEETARLANSSIKAMVKLAEGAHGADDLLALLRKANTGYRIGHCLLLTYLCFHVLDASEATGEEPRSILSQSAFYHDLSLRSEDYAKIRSGKMLAAIESQADRERVYAHAQLAAKELEASPVVPPSVARIVLRHHGSPTGRGFFSRIARFDFLTKTFILAEEWCDYLMHLAETGAPRWHVKRLAELQAQYPDDECRRILAVFRALEPSAFADAAPGEAIPPESADASAAEPGREAAAEGDEEKEIDEEGEAQAVEGEMVRIVKEVTYRRTDEASRVTESALSPGGRERTTIKGVTHHRRDEEHASVGNEEPREPGPDSVLPGGSPDDETVSTVKEVTYRRKDEDVKIEDQLESGEEQVREVKGVTYRHDDGEARVAGETPAANAQARTFQSATHHREDDVVVVTDTEERTQRIAALARAPGPTGSKVKSVLAELRKENPRFRVEHAEASLLAAGIALPELAAPVREFSGADAEDPIARMFARERAKEKKPDAPPSPGGVEEKSAAESVFPPPETETRVEKEERAREAIRGNPEEAVRVGPSPGERPAPAQAVQGVTYHRLDEKIVVKARAERLLEASRAAGVELPELIVKDTSEAGAAPAEPAGGRGASEGAEEPAPQWRIQNITDVTPDEASLVLKNDPAEAKADPVFRFKANAVMDQGQMRVKSLVGSTKLMKAAAEGNEQRMREILAGRSDELRKVDAQGRTAVHYAAEAGFVEALRILIDAGAGINAVDAKRRSPLFLAALSRDKKAFDFLLERGAKVNQQDSGGMTIAMVLARDGELAMMEALIARGVRLEARDHNGRTAKDHAEDAGQKQVLEFLEARAGKTSP